MLFSQCTKITLFIEIFHLKIFEFKIIILKFLIFILRQLLMKWYNLIFKHNIKLTIFEQYVDRDGEKK